MVDSADLQRELAAYEFAPTGEETATTVVWKDTKGNQISVAKEYERCPDHIKQIHLAKIRALHSPYPTLLQQCYRIVEKDEESV